ncbi:hypothetical protein EAH78_13395 [Pseudomonas arsenicoxydans]|uniref:Uncharacterized protein n=1 Tax=Pseudomonas arsenicoxydans TaxID=702115 RepID=A0A502HUY2_9PSED|nr:hypothetical protein EAH78_13395 [Pseudomonas arsenicoxydans]
MKNTRAVRCGYFFSGVFVLDVRPPSRASPLPHSTDFSYESGAECGSGLAREGDSGSTIVPSGQAQKNRHP